MIVLDDLSLLFVAFGKRAELFGAVEAEHFGDVPAVIE
jgi:hypothetical protein